MTAKRVTTETPAPGTTVTVMPPEEQTNVALPGDWQARLAANAKVAVENERSVGQFFSAKSGVLSWGGTPVPNNRMQVICVANIYENIFYTQKFQTDAPVPPRCYAFSHDGRDIAPYESVIDPISPTCEKCPNMAWGTADAGQGKGKACKEQRRLALLPVSALHSPEEIMTATVGYLRVPVTSTKQWSSHVKHAALMGMPVWAIITEVILSPDPRVMQRFDFSIVRTITDVALLTALEKRMAVENQAIIFPYSTPTPPGGQSQGAAPAARTKF